MIEFHDLIIETKLLFAQIMKKNNFLSGGVMKYPKESFECTVQELDRELVARGAQLPMEEMFHFENSEVAPQQDEIMEKVRAFYKEKAQTLKPDPELSHISTEELVKVLLYKTGRIEVDGVR